MIFKVFGANETQPQSDDLAEVLEEAEFEVTVEVVEADDDEEWTEILLYEANYEEPIRVFRQTDADTLAGEVDELISALDTEEKSTETVAVLDVLEGTVIGFGVELPEEYLEEDNMLLMASLVAQFLAGKSDGLYSVDNEGFFDENGDLLLELAWEE